MAITIKDIQEKEFSIQQVNGYSIEEVDDFLDAIVEEMANLTRLNYQLRTQKQDLEEKLAQAQQKANPAYDEASYFKNLETAMRETLISSQRLADETTANARAQAEQAIAAANQQAQDIVANADAKAAQTIGVAQEAADALAAQAEDARAKLNAYVADLRTLAQSIAQAAEATQL